MYAVVRRYKFDKSASKEINQKVREGFVPIMKKARGFVAYYWLDTGRGEGASVSVFDDLTGAEESVRLAADFVKNNKLEALISQPEIIQGQVQAHS